MFAKADRGLAILQRMQTRPRLQSIVVGIRRKIAPRAFMTVLHITSGSRRKGISHIRGGGLCPQASVSDLPKDGQHGGSRTFPYEASGFHGGETSGGGRVGGEG